MYSHTVTQLQGDALNIAKSAVTVIDGDEFEKLSKSLNGSDKFYIGTRKKLQELNNSIGKGMLYTFVSNDSDNYTYVIDGSDANTEIGYKQPKADFSKEAKKAFDTGEAQVSEMYYVESLKNHYISAFVPILNSANKVVGVVEYDYRGSDLSERTHQLTVIIILVTIVLIGISIIINYIAS